MDVLWIGSLNALVGESDLRIHEGARVTAGVLRRAAAPPASVSTVFRTIWRIKSLSTPLGTKGNARPDLQQLVLQSQVLGLCDSSEERGPDRLESRVRAALENPAAIRRFGGWSLGESTNLINDAWLWNDLTRLDEFEVFLLSAKGNLSLPVWVDHVATSDRSPSPGDSTRTEIRGHPTDFFG